MADYRMDGQYLKDSNGNRVAQIDGNYIKDSNGNRVGQIDGQYIKDANGTRIGTMADVRKEIDGPGGATLAALWVLFIR